MEPLQEMLIKNSKGRSISFVGGALFIRSIFGALNLPRTLRWPAPDPCGKKKLRRDLRWVRASTGDGAVHGGRIYCWLAPAALIGISYWVRPCCERCDCRAQPLSTR